MIKTLIAAIVFALFAAAPARAADGGVVVLGGTGRLGAEIVRALVAAGEEVTVLARATSDTSRLDGLDVTFVTGDLLVETDVARLFTGAPFRAAIDATGIPPDGDPAFYPQSMTHIVRWAQATGVGRIVLHSSVGAGDSADLFQMDNVDEIRKASYAAKGKAEAILTESGVPFTIIRAMTVLPEGTVESGAAMLTRDRTAIGAISRDALARLTLACLDDPAAADTIFHAFDPAPTLTGRYAGLWDLFAQIFKPEVVAAWRPD